MIGLRKPSAAGFAGILFISFLAMSAPASAGGGGPGGGGSRGGPGRPPPPVFLEGSSWPGSRKWLLHFQQASHQHFRQGYWVSSCPNLQLMHWPSYAQAGFRY